MMAELAIHHRTVHHPTPYTTLHQNTHYTTVQHYILHPTPPHSIQHRTPKHSIHHRTPPHSIHHRTPKHSIHHRTTLHTPPYTTTLHTPPYNTPPCSTIHIRTPPYTIILTIPTIHHRTPPYINTPFAATSDSGTTMGTGTICIEMCTLLSLIQINDGTRVWVPKTINGLVSVDDHNNVSIVQRCDCVHEVVTCECVRWCALVYR